MFTLFQHQQLWNTWEIIFIWLLSTLIDTPHIRRYESFIYIQQKYIFLTLSACLVIGCEEYSMTGMWSHEWHRVVYILVSQDMNRISNNTCEEHFVLITNNILLPSLYSRCSTVVLKIIQVMCLSDRDILNSYSLHDLYNSQLIGLLTLSTFWRTKGSMF